MHNILGLVHRLFPFAITLFTLGLVNTAKELIASTDQSVLDFSDEILSSTVQIRIYDPENTYFSYGLGSLFVFQENEYILTHSHWYDLYPDSRVQFRDWQDSILIEVSGQEFMDLIQYQDAGSFIAATPRTLCCPAHLLEGNLVLSRNDQVDVAHYDSRGHDRIKISKARVLQVGRDGVLTYAITMLGEEQAYAGDSGAGIWYEGKLVANLWFVILANPPVQQWEKFHVIHVARFPEIFYKQLYDDLNLKIFLNTGHFRKRSKNVF